MGFDTNVGWAHDTFNPWWGCVHKNEGCRNCYAGVFANRLGYSAKGTKKLPLWGASARRRFFDAKHWSQPLRWNRAAKEAGARRRVFCASMADVFELLATDHPDYAAMHEARLQLWDLIDKTPHLIWMLLTKRAENLHLLPEGLSNVWLGASAIDQPSADEQLPLLLKTPAAVHFASYEPLLGPIDASRYLQFGSQCECDPLADPSTRCTPEAADHWIRCNPGTRRLAWGIVGGESGPKARLLHPDWVRSLRDQHTAAERAFFFKQWGTWLPFYDRDQDDPDWRQIPKESSSVRRINLAGGQGFHGERVVYFRRAGMKKAGRLLDNRTWDQVPPDLPDYMPVTAYKRSAAAPSTA